MYSFPFPSDKNYLDSLDFCKKPHKSTFRTNCANATFSAIIFTLAQNVSTLLSLSLTLALSACQWRKGVSQENSETYSHRIYIVRSCIQKFLAYSNSFSIHFGVLSICRRRFRRHRRCWYLFVVVAHDETRSHFVYATIALFTAYSVDFPFGYICSAIFTIKLSKFYTIIRTLNDSQTFCHLKFSGFWSIWSTGDLEDG